MKASGIIFKYIKAIIRAFLICTWLRRGTDGSAEIFRPFRVGLQPVKWLIYLFLEIKKEFRISGYLSFDDEVC